MKQARKNLDARKIFNHAERFHWTDDYVRRHNDQRIAEIVLLPTMVLAAFAAELFLKCLHCIDSNDVPPGHSLKQLYSDLPKLRRDSIVAYWNGMMADQKEMLDQRDKNYGTNIPRDLDTAIAELDCGFENLRYVYENHQFKFYVSDLPTVLRTVILQIQPTWGSFYRNPDVDPQTRSTSHSH